MAITFKAQAAQGDLMIRRIDAIPSGVATERAIPVGGRHVVAHSETGHHHSIGVDGVDYLTVPGNPLIAYLRCELDSVLLHERPHDTHAPIAIAKGIYEIRRQREYTPEGWRRVED